MPDAVVHTLPEIRGIPDPKTYSMKCKEIMQRNAKDIKNKHNPKACVEDTAKKPRHSPTGCVRHSQSLC